MRKSKEQKVERAPKPLPSPGQQWSAGDKYKTIAGASLITALLLTGPAALVYTAFKPSSVSATQQDDLVSGLSEVQQRAGGTGVDFIAAWLSATEKDHDAFDQFGLNRPTALPAEAAATKDLRLLSVAPGEPDENQLIVSVSALVEHKPKSWVRSYYSVPMIVTGDQVSPVSLPSQISVPALSEDALTARYSTQVTGTVTDTVSGFFDSYLAGVGDLDRLLTPDYALNPVEPTPFTSVKLVDLRGTTDISDSPSDGDTAELQATVLTSTATQKVGLTTTYTLSMTARAGRWEVSALNPYPTLSDPSIDESADLTETE